MKNYKTIIQLSILILITTLTFILSAFNIEKSDKKINIINARSVKIEPVRHDRAGLTFDYTGTLSPATSTKLSFKTGGYISYIIPENITSVKQGTILAKLDKEEINARVRQTKESYEKAKRDFKRADNLFNSEAITKEIWQNVSTALSVSEEEYNIALYNQKHSIIRAPQNGRILKRLTENSTLVPPGMPILIFGNLQGGWKAIINLSEKDVARISKTDSATVSISAFSDLKIKGYISAISDSPNPHNGTFKTEISLTDSPNNLRTGYTVNVSLFPKSLSAISWIPISALIKGDGNLGTVFVPKNKSAEEVTIKIEGFKNGYLAVKHIYFPFDSVITDGAFYLKNNEEIISNPQLTLLSENSYEAN